MLPYAVGGFPFVSNGPCARQDGGTVFPPFPRKGHGKEGSPMSVIEFVVIVGLMISCFGLGFALGRSQKDK